MKSFFCYDNVNDQTVWFSPRDVILTPGMVRISACSISGDQSKPNEDAFAVTIYEGGLRVGVFDGTTEVQSVLESQKTSGGRFASHFLKHAFQSASEGVSPAEILLWLNRNLGIQIQKLHSQAGVNNPASTGTIVTLDIAQKSLKFAHVGDSFCIAYMKDGRSRRLTTNQNERFDQKVFQMIKRVSEEKRIVPRKAREEPSVKEQLLMINKSKSNNPTGNGCGLINGDEHMRMYLEDGTLTLSDVTAVLLGTDGLIPQDLFLDNESDRRIIYATLMSEGFPTLIKAKRKSEDLDPEWQNIRYKHSDDATGVFVEFREQTGGEFLT